MGREDNEDIPGCIGDPVSKWDYCIPEGVIINTGSNPEGMLQLCEGDCDRDSDCGEGLKCFQREDNEDIPGCIGDPLSKWDYCIPEGVIIINTGVNPEGMLQLCEGDCDRDSDCGEGLKCFQREDNEDIPGCIGDPVSKWDYCITMPPTKKPTTPPTSKPTNAPTPRSTTRPPTLAPTPRPTIPATPCVDYEGLMKFINGKGKKGRLRCERAKRRSSL